MLGHDRAGSIAPRLVGREAQVARLAAEGLTDGQIAERLGISASTVGEYWKRLLARLGARSRTQAVALVAEREVAALRQDLARLREEASR